MDYTFQLSFPTDEQVLRRIRQMMQEGTEIEINHHTVSVDEMTAENYSVRWYVFKYDITDGWHIDGVLVSRQGTMVVTKTFAGAQDAINAVKQNYSISVTAQAGATHTGGTLHLNDAGVLYDEATNTYRWEVPVDRYYNYTVTENNYLLSGELYATTAQYMVQNSKTANQNTTGWQTYTTSGVTVTGQSHHEDDPQKLTVSFLNTYTPPGELVVRKIDQYTGHGMAGITFTVKDANDNALPLIDNGNSHYALAADSGTGYTVTSEIVTDHNGQIYLTLPEGTYKLEEVLPAGYDNPGIITVVLAMDTSTNEVVLQSADSSGGDKYVTTHGDQLEITANNYAKEFSLTVHKNWLDPDTKPVTLRLLQNGVPIRDPVTLDGTVDVIETRPWEATFTDLRLYIDGQVANYTLREERIGEFAYSTEYPGGYRYYNVNYAPIVYYDADGAVTEDPVEAVTANLSVSNSRNTVTDVTITKEITGALANFDKVFHFVVDAQSPMADGEGYILSSNKKQATFTLGHGDSVTLRNVKIGETLVITETAEGYTIRMLVDSATVTNPVTITEDMTVVVRNSKDHVPDAGIWLDKWPYLLIIGGAAAAAIVLIVRKRRKKDDD